MSKSKTCPCGKPVRKIGQRYCSECHAEAERERRARVKEADRLGIDPKDLIKPKAEPKTAGLFHAGGLFGNNEE